MKSAGFAAFAVSGFLLLIAFVYDTAPEGTHNIGLLQTQMMLLTLAGVLGLAGTITTCFAIALQRMEEAGLIPPAGSGAIASSKGKGEV